MTSASETAFAAAYETMLRLWTAPPESRDVRTSPAETTRVQVWGKSDAPPLVLLHGFHVTSTMWAPNAADLGATRRVYAPDTLGDFGFSRPAKMPRTSTSWSTWLGALLDALGLRPRRSRRHVVRRLAVGDVRGAPSRACAAPRAPGAGRVVRRILAALRAARNADDRAQAAPRRRQLPALGGGRRASTTRHTKRG